MIGEVIGNYRVLDVLGEGGMGVVYRAEHVTLGKPVALKMLQPGLSSDPAMVQRFFNEARAASTIDHPGIVEILDYGTYYDGRAYIAMPLLSGESLEARLRRTTTLTPMLAASLIAQVASALQAAHARGIIHRDLKPDNIFLVPNELMPDGIQIKLLDFGIAKLSNDKGEHKTQTGALLGTPAYMSPEQCMGKAEIDHRTDIYALGCILYRVLTGQPPFTSEHGSGMLIASHLRDVPADPLTLHPELPANLVAITMRCLEKEPGARFQSAAELRSALIDAGAHTPTLRGTEGSAIRTGTGRVALGADKTLAAGSAPPPPTTFRGSAGQVSSTTAPSSKLPLVFATLGGVALVAGAVLFFTRRPQEPDESAPPVAAATTPAPAASVDSAPKVVPAPPDPSSQQVPPAAQRMTPQQPGPGVPTAIPPPVAPRFTLSVARVFVDTDVAIRFATPVTSVGNDRLWASISKQGAPATSYETWSYITDGARVLTLKAPSNPGNYEVRVYTGYPRLTHNVGRVEPLVVEAIAELPPQEIAATTSPNGSTALNNQRFMLAGSKVKAGAKISITFPQPMVAAGTEQFWVTVVPQGTADTAYDAWTYVTANASTSELPAPAAPGSYEVRLHANYPTKSTNVVHRVPLQVE